ncbi:hypothetical protein SEA_YECEY3_100 [Mycobacterium phage Yecey3]|uniref:Uncharacterized protein n=1 Tax=Mycobacterium phage Yecey3 TaxID=2656617 RepID=A0A649V918_9CAUD|nr:hypothetical protein KIV58_gp009 [Mycobacterium phage Yecey3]QGJ88851.1 hypothetical protein SEA_YECEY3_100 [Mycobacterium phage Yecey3]
MNKPDSQRVRVRAVHGWAFRDEPEDICEGIRKYLDTGNPDHLDPSYRYLRDGVYEDMPVRQRH